MSKKAEDYKVSINCPSPLTAMLEVHSANVVSESELNSDALAFFENTLSLAEALLEDLVLAGECQIVHQINSDKDFAKSLNSALHSIRYVLQCLKMEEE